MNKSHKLDNIDLTAAFLEREYRVTVRSPLGGVPVMLEALGSKLPLRQGAYDNCLYVTGSGHQLFRPLEGSHAGDTNNIQTTEAADIIFTIPQDVALLQKAFEVIFAFTVNEDPTIFVEEIWGSRSKYLDDNDNPNRYWNRSDGDALHGVSSPASQDREFNAPRTLTVQSDF